MLTNELLKATNFGAEWILWLLIALFILEVAVMVERTFFYFKYRLNINSFQAKFRDLLFSGDIESVKSELSKKRSFETNALIEGVKMIDFGAESVEETIESMKNTNRVVLDRNLTILGTLGNNTPFIGLFGTVLGIIKAFKDLAEASNSAGGDMLKAGQAAVMAGIAEALIATGVGLAVAIPAVIAFNYFTRKVKVIQTNTDILAGVLMSYIKRDDESSDNTPPQKKMNTSKTTIDSKNDSKKKIELDSENHITSEKKEENFLSKNDSFKNETEEEQNNLDEKREGALINSEKNEKETHPQTPSQKGALINSENNSISEEKNSNLEKEKKDQKKSDKNKKNKK